jgi:hypothetical protein
VRLIPDSWGSRPLREFNANHEPAGSPKGGQFAPITAYHGTAAKFDQFDAAKIGTGEGNQAFGYGLYFTENPRIGNWYKDSLSQRLDADVAGSQVPNWIANGILAASQSGPAELKKTLDGYITDFEDRLKQAKEDKVNPNTLQPHLLDGVIIGLEDTLKGLKSARDGAAVEKPGHLYTVQINAPISKFIDWEKPAPVTPEQLGWTKKAVGPDEPREGMYKDKFGITRDPHGLTGEQVVKALGPTKGASDLLKSLGFAGIRYHANAGNSTDYNYVVFDPSIVKVVHREAVAFL